MTLNGTKNSDLHLCAVSGDADDPLIERVYAAPPRLNRTAFQRDRERIVQARAFRRLAGKTQVFTSRSSDHFRSRLTHTIEVVQIARLVAQALGLNEDLAEVLALVHDIGHPPFGHAGERALDECLKSHGLRFDHNLHALRIVEHFEMRYAAHRGLNLTLGVREGIIKHSHDYTVEQYPVLAPYLLDRRPPLEAQIIDLADEIAYLTADLDDGLDSGILTLSQVREGVALFRGFHDAVLADYPAAPPKLAAYETLKRILNALVTDLIQEIRRQAAALGATTLQEIRRAPNRMAALSPPMEAARAAAKEFLYANLYYSPGIEEAHAHATEVVQGLFAALIADPGLLPEDHQAQIPTEGLARTVADYIAGMTDSYIEQAWRRLGE